MAINKDSNKAVTVEDLAKFFSQVRRNDVFSEGERPIEYVVYLRKSTEGEEKQEKSLMDQRDECLAFAKEKGLYIGKVGKLNILEEKASAKESGIRPVFDQMIRDIESGKYQGLLAWHPNRLARNMKDGGLIIDLLDKEIIRDLKFVSFYSDSTASGKMLLGMSFVLSKQYSDQLSQDITRAIKARIRDGQYIGKIKHGYYKDVNQFARPDGKNYTIIKNAFEMRLNGSHVEDILNYLNNSDYQKAKYRGGTLREDHKFSSIKEVYKLFKDPFYAGVMAYGKNADIVDLTNVYDFVPVISADEFLTINNIKSLQDPKFLKLVEERGLYFNGRGMRSSAKDVTQFLNGRVLCSCGGHRHVQKVKKKLKDGSIRQYITFRCGNKRCRFYGQSTRGKVILDFVKDFLRNYNFGNEETYISYKEEMEKLNKIQHEKLGTQIRERKKDINDLNEKIQDLKDYLPQLSDKPSLQREYENDLEVKLNTLKELEHNFKELKVQKDSLDTSIFEYEKFLELFNKLPETLIKTKDLATKEMIIKKVFSNFILDKKKVLSYRLNEPFKMFLEKGIVKDSSMVEMRGIEPLC